jgi:hypothetical protein
MAANDAPDFSQLIRGGLPNPMPSPSSPADPVLVRASPTRHEGSRGIPRQFLLEGKSLVRGRNVP